MIHLSDVNQMLAIITEASVKLSFLVGEPVELQIIKPKLPELSPSQKMVRQMDLDRLKITITQLVCEQFMISPARLRSKSRKTELTDARKLSAYLLYTYVKGIKDEEIGEILNFDRSSAIHNRNKCEDLLQTDKDFRFQYNQILKRLTKVIEHD